MKECVQAERQFQQNILKCCDLLISNLFNVSIVSLALMMLVVTADVIMRSFFNSPIMGTLEYTEFLMVCTIAPVFAYIQRKDKPLAVDMFIVGLSPVKRSILDIFIWFTSFLFMGFLSWEMLKNTHERFVDSEATLLLNIKIWYFYAFATFSLLLFTLTMFFSAYKSIIFVTHSKKILFAILAIVLALILFLAPFVLADTFLAFSKATLGGIIMLYLFIMIMTSMPIGMAMLIAGMQGAILVMPNVTIAMTMVANSPFTTISAAHLSVIPMFVLMGELALIGGVSSDLFRTASTWVGAMPGGLAVASVTGCAGFAAVCGESIPTAMTMASVALPSMREKGYDPAFGCACLSVGGTLGILIPPSLGFIMYAIITEQSVSKLFLAGIVPGILLTVIICGIVIFRAIRNPKLAPRGNKTSWKEKFASLTGIIPMVLLFLVIMGGILGGYCSPNEGGAIGASFTLLYCLVRRRINFKQFKYALEGTALLTGKIFLVMLGVNILGYFLAATRLPFALTDIIATLNANKYIVLSATILLYIVLGCLMNVIPMIMLTLPSLFPTILAVGFDPIWFGVITVLLMELGQITPPIGVLVFALSGAVSDVPVQSIYKHVIPFFLGIFACIVLLIFFPQLCLWLPNFFS